MQIYPTDELRISHPFCSPLLCPNLSFPNARLAGITNIDTFHWRLFIYIHALHHCRRANNAAKYLNHPMQRLAELFMIISIICYVFSAFAEINGSITVSSRRTGMETYTRGESPKEFRCAMNFNWIASSIPALTGFLLLWFIRRQDRLDPFSSHFKGSQALNDLSDYLDRESKKQSKERDISS